MRIHIYEEFPTQKNLEKLKLINFPTRIYLAAATLTHFKKYEAAAKKQNRKVECAYWPTVKKTYWLSPFTPTSEIERLAEEVENCDNHLLIDAEPPRNYKLILKNWKAHKQNKSRIEQLCKEHQERITVARWPPLPISGLLKRFSFATPEAKETSLMFYTSMNSRLTNSVIRSKLKNLKDKNRYSLSLGTITTGVLGDEPVLSPQQLEQDLQFAQQAGFNNIILFRLGGLNQEYKTIIDRFASRLC